MPKAVAFIDESGDRGLSETSTPHFVLAAVVMPEDRTHEAAKWLANLRRDLNVGPQAVVSWKKHRTHAQRLHAATRLGEQPFARVSAVVTCKRHLPRQPSFTHDHLYMFAFRLLLERLSWLARDKEMELEYLLGHIRGFSVDKLREYESRLRGIDTTIDWRHVVSPRGGAIGRPEVEEHLQIADIAASAIGAAFNPDDFGRTETRYLSQFTNRLYRGNGAAASAGLKMHPWNEATRAAYPWVAAL